MTARKADLRLPSRTPAYVSREVGAAEIGVSPETWDKWVERGVLPAPAPGFPESTPRWRWADVDTHLAGIPKAVQSAPVLALGSKGGNIVDPFVASAGRFANGSKGKRRG
ncbi:hypothetical protein AA309_19930 [Microvirga vignae]|uniref:Uncharacterized protein n=1 Tax=Microvirga vignae TaxID=1225564 RepID=A0A0H1R886_9HYPH|nr:hypothetical protein AA309_19930 [Microvirga vignae]